MKKVILIIENDDTKKIAEQLINAFADRPSEDIELILAKTQLAADNIIANNKNLYAVISSSDTGTVLNLLKKDCDKPADNFTLKPYEVISDQNAAECESDLCDRDCALDCAQEIAYKDYNSSNTIETRSLSELLAALESLDLIKTPGEHRCEKHDEIIAEFNALKIQTELNKERLLNIKHEIDNCPAKKSFFDKPAKPDSDNKPSMTLTLSFITFAGVILTASFGLLGKLFEVLFNYLKITGGN